MNQTKETATRRDFVKGTGAAAGMAALAAVLGGGKAEAHEIELNAMGPTPEQMKEFMALPDGPVVMVNLLKFKPDGGAAEYAKYGAKVSVILKSIGAKILFSGQVQCALLGGATWDAVALVEYPDKTALMKMSQSAEYQAIHHHRADGLEGQINLAVFQNAILES